MLRLKDYRDANGLTIAQVAARVGVPYETYRKWEKGDSKPDFEHLGILADVLNCTMDDLAGRRRTLTSDEIELLGMYRGTDERGRAQIMAVARVQPHAGDSAPSSGVRAS